MSSGRLIGSEAPLSPLLARSGVRKRLAADFGIVQIFPHSCGYADPASAHPNPPVASSLEARVAWSATDVLRICRTVPIEIWSPDARAFFRTYLSNSQSAKTREMYGL